MKCEECGNAYTGYIVKKKKIYYYKCRTIGCKCNQNAEDVNELFEQYLDTYKINPELVLPLKQKMHFEFDKLNNSQRERMKNLRTQMADVQQNIDRLDDKYYVKEEMDEETYKKLVGKYREEKSKILDGMETCGKDSSNYTDYFSFALQISSKLTSIWTSGGIPVKEKVQEIIFPEGVVYNRKNQTFRTTKTNEVFSLIADVNTVSGDVKNGLVNKIVDQSIQVGKTGFEPATPWSQTKCATGLRYFPITHFYYVRLST